MSQFVRVTPTGRNMPPQLLLNTHCIDKLTEDSRGVVIVMKSAHAAEHIHIAEQSPYRRPRDDGRRKAGRITLTECLEGHPAQQTSFSLSDIRMIERTPSGGAVVRFGIDGSGRFEAFEGFDTVANMIESHAPVKLEKLVTDTVEAKPQTAKLKPVPKEPPQRKALRHRGKLIKNMEIIMLNEQLPKRQRNGGRPKGSPNKATAARQKRIAESGLTPLDYLLRIMRDESLDHHQRMEAAKAAAPYVHPKLASIEHRGDGENPIGLQLGFRWMTEAEARCRGWA